MSKDNLEVLKRLNTDLEVAHNAKYQDMELELLGMMILPQKKGECIPVIRSYLKADDFTSPEHAAIFNACVSLYDEGTLPNLTLVADWLKNHNYTIYNSANGEAIANANSNVGCVTTNTIMNLGQAAFTDAYADNYAAILAKAALKRKMLKHNLQSIQNIFRDTMSPDEMLNADQQIIDELTGNSKVKNFEGIAEFLTGKNDITESKLFQYFEEFQKFANRKTGFENFDAVQILAPSVQVIGGLPGTGKTTFCWQLLNQLAERGEHCLYFSYEMSNAEIFTKTLAREHFKICNARDIPTLNSIGIRKGDFWNVVIQGKENPLYESAMAFIDGVIPRAKLKYKTLKIYEAEDETIDDILRMIRPFCQSGKAPIVCIDYLQLISPTDPKLTEADNLKIVMKRLKRFSTTTNTTFIIISALNRDSYAGGDTLKGFRGTSAIEFSCDAAYLLNLNFDPKVESAESAQRKQPRGIRLKCLKNRFGNTFEIYFDYASAHDYFVSAEAPDVVDDTPAEPKPAESAPPVTNEDDEEEMRRG